MQISFTLMKGDEIKQRSPSSAESESLWPAAVGFQGVPGRKNSQIVHCKTSYFSTLHTIEAGLRCWLEFYSPVDGSHSELVIPHMLYHLRELAVTEHGDPQVILTYTMPGYIGNREELKALVTDQLGLSPGRIGEKPMILLGCSLSDIFTQSSKL